MDKKQREERRRQEDIALQRGLLWVVGAVVLEALLVLVNRFYINYSLSDAGIQLCITLHEVLRVLRIAAPVAAVLSLAWAVWQFRQKKKYALPLILAIALAAAAICVHVIIKYQAAGVSMLYWLVVAWAVLALVFYIYQREFFLAAAACGMSVLGLWFVRYGLSGQKEAIALLVPIGIGMLLSIAIFAKIFSEVLFPRFPLQTNLFFIGLILGGLPVIYGKVKGNTIKIPQILAFVLFFVMVVGFALVGEGGDASADISFSVVNVIKLFGVGIIAAATMVIPGVSGSMIMMILGYYNTIIDTINDFINALKNFDITAMLETFVVLVPFGVGVVVGVVAVAKLIEFMLKKYPLVTYWAIIGLIVASPFAILIMMQVGAIGIVEILTGVVLLAVGFLISLKLGA